MPCAERISSICDAGHKQSWMCSDGRPKTCPKCEREAKLAKRRQEQEVEAQKRREIEQREHLAHLDAINAQIDKENQAREDARLKQERSRAIKQKENDLAALIASRAESTVATPPATAEALALLKSQQMLPSPSEFPATASSMLDGRDVKTPSDNATSNSSLPAESTSQMLSSSDGRDESDDASSNSPLPPVKAETISQVPSPPKPFPKLAESPSKKEWSRQKNMEGASNPSIDAIMDMTGLEDVKKKVLNIKTKIDLSIRQNSSLKQERFNAALLGNPGTGGCSRLEI